MSPLFRILCVGDSLTEGYHHYGTAFHPYSLTLERSLLNYPRFKDASFTVTTDGRSGDRVLSPGTFVSRLEMRLREAEQEGFTYDWVVILGGINDIGYRIDAVAIFSGLKELWSMALRHGSKVIALSCLEWDVEQRDGWIAAQVKRLNGLIEGFQGTCDGWFFYDIRCDVPQFALAGEERDIFWDDGMHLTAAGYDRMGECIANALLRFEMRNRN
ncbi:SGNH hydrolase-type esterase domain-containing protein [Fimicolochytrium jonesii]|uniref:SGNH hydrolase-type esterase domain-containing protein n=1 Tax=Fimicolochytrium jonesii TaxID=1396493 RepID=UPI0022FF0049|nr:SGNH hydrolase-type esterase domain-containing protein [Fimicolochytrium jonesii]KAI8815999.1 SGNH hydrolase-type esterase domain-containing protein [Fimicolochytrium jonesii]